MRHGFRSSTSVHAYKWRPVALHRVQEEAHTNTNTRVIRRPGWARLGPSRSRCSAAPLVHVGGAAVHPGYQAGGRARVDAPAGGSPQRDRSTASGRPMEWVRVTSPSHQSKSHVQVISLSVRVTSPSRQLNISSTLRCSSVALDFGQCLLLVGVLGVIPHWKIQKGGHDF